MKIAFDARSASHPQAGGFKTYTTQLIYHLPRVCSENHYVLYLDRPLDPVIFGGMRNVTVKVVKTSVGPLGAGLREQFHLPCHLVRDRVELVHFPTNTASLRSPRPFVVTAHDTISWAERPRMASRAAGEFPRRWGMFWYSRWMTLAALRQARAVITVSEHSKSDLVRRFGINPDRLAVIYQAPADQFSPIADRAKLDGACNKFGLRHPFILALGSASERKNVHGLIAAYARLTPDLRAHFQLVIVWTHGLWKNEIARQTRQYGLEGRVVFLECVKDDDLVGLYNAASLFVFPSLYEGFGLPPLEAMACGTPVVASNLSCLPEILGDAALLVDPRDPDALASAMAAVLRSPELARDLSAKGGAWVQRYSWDRCALETVQVYERVYASCYTRPVSQ